MSLDRASPHGTGAPPPARPPARVDASAPSVRSGHALQDAAIGVGGSVGAAARYLTVRAVPAWHGLPVATLVANLVGVVLLGWGVTRLQERLAPTLHQRPFLATGVCGALTTFSTFQLELVTLARHHRPLAAAGYLVVSVALGLVLMLLSSNLARRAALA